MLAAGVDVRLDTAAVDVELAEDGVRVRCADGTTEAGSHVVVTVPLGVLKQGALTFTPDLPADRTAAIARLGFGCYEKVAMRFEQPFWRNAGLGHALIFPRDPTEATMWVINQDAFGGGPTLVCQVVHSASHHVVGRSEAAAVEWATGNSGPRGRRAVPDAVGGGGDRVGHRPLVRWRLHPPAAGGGAP